MWVCVSMASEGAFIFPNIRNNSPNSDLKCCNRNCNLFICTFSYSYRPKTLFILEKIIYNLKVITTESKETRNKILAQENTKV